jgi:hypothetical protein
MNHPPSLPPSLPAYLTPLELASADFKRRWGVLGSRGLFLYRSHDDDARDFVCCLDLSEEGTGGALRAERLGEHRKGGRRKSEDYSYWRVWIERDEVFMGGRGAEEERWSVVCRGTEAACRDWMAALGGGLGSSDAAAKERSMKAATEGGMWDVNLSPSR